jgi:hypothetical protein
VCAKDIVKVGVMIINDNNNNDNNNNNNNNEKERRNECITIRENIRRNN